VLIAKRDIFGELMEGAAAMKSHRAVRNYKVDAAALPKVDSKLIRDTRKRLRCSRAVFARRLRINEKNFGKMGTRPCEAESSGGVSRLLVRRYPDTLARLDKVAAR
jgi:putative transcriptional regulator